MGKVATSPLLPGGPHRFRAGGQNPKWPTSGQGGYITPAASGGPHRFRAGRQNQKWPTSGHGGYITPAAWGVPTASERGDTIRIGPQVGKVATSPLPPRGVPTASERWDRIRIGPQVGKMATLPLPLGGPHRFRAGGQNQNWPTSGQGGYITPAVWGVPTASDRGDRIRSGPQVGKVATSPLPPRGSPPLQSGGKESELAEKWARWLHYPCHLGVPTASELGDRIRIGPQVGKMDTSPLPSGGPHRFRAGGQNQKWPTSGQGGYITPAAWGSPPLRSGGTESEVAHKWARWLHHPCRLGGSPPLQSWGTESEVAHKWARWLHHPCRLGGPHRFKAGGQNQRWPTSGQGGYITRADGGFPTASERGDRIRSGPQVGKVATSPLPLGGSPPLQSGGTESEVAHKWAWWLHHPCRLRGPHRFRAGGQDQNWPTSGQGGYITRAAWGVPTASERGDRIRSGPQVGKVATSPLPPRGVPTASERGDRIRSGPQVGKVATSPVPPGGSPPLQSGGTESEVAHKWARWLHHPFRLRGPQRFRAGDRIRIGSQVGKAATSPLPPWGSPPLQSGGQNQKWPTSGQGGYITSAAWGVPTASERGDRIRSGPQVGKVATSPLLSEGSPPF